jgi:hypothetical protein
MTKIILGALGLALICGIAIGQHMPRFEFIYRQDVGDDRSGPNVFTVFHDTATGQEIVCIVASSSISGSSSCYLTGRKWGGDNR